jgi:collagen beta-1,O-galactosyltransferase
MCWQKAVADAADPALILEDDAVLADDCAARIQSRLARLSTIDPHWDLLYLGRWARDDEDRAVTEGIVHPGYSYCTFGYLLSASALAAVLSSDIPADPGDVHGTVAFCC